jgi:hypothetical protein
MKKAIITLLVILLLIISANLAATKLLSGNGVNMLSGVDPDTASDAASGKDSDAASDIMSGKGIFDVWAGMIAAPGSAAGQEDGGSDSDKEGESGSGANESGSGANESGGGVNESDSGVNESGNNAGGVNRLTGVDAVNLIIEEGTTVSERIKPPEGYERIKPGSFGEFLQTLPLKPHGTRVRYYDGNVKPFDVHAAVIDMDVGNRDLQQCADAVIRLRAEYLYSKGMYEHIHFNFTNGFNAEYKKWMEGYRIKVSGNDARWAAQESRDDSYGCFRKYLDMVFTYAGTLSLSKEMERISLQDLRPGDVFLKGGTPGHCVIVVDMAVNPETGEKVFLIAQSYMPAQDIHILKNPSKGDGDPWYPLDFGDVLVTPEWTFTADQVYRFS